MVRGSGYVIVATALWSLSACASTSFVSTWRAPDVQPLSGEGRRAAAVVMSTDNAIRRAGEDALAREITRQGAEGIALYTLARGTDALSESHVRAALEKAGVTAVVVMRPVRRESARGSAPVSYGGPYDASPVYRGLWGGYWAYGWNTASGGTMRSDAIISIETLVYSMKQNRLVWAGQSKTTKPTNLDGLVREIVSAVAREMKKEGLIEP